MEPHVHTTVLSFCCIDALKRNVGHSAWRYPSHFSKLSLGTRSKKVKKETLATSFHHDNWMTLSIWQYRLLSTYFVQYEQKFFLSLVFQDSFLQLRTAAAQGISSIQNLHYHVRCLNNLHKNSIQCKINLVNDNFGDHQTNSGIYHCQFVMLDISLLTCLV